MDLLSQEEMCRNPIHMNLLSQTEEITHKQKG